MKKYIICFVVICFFLLVACQQQPGVPDNTVPERQSEELPQLVYGRLASERLETVAWNSGRTEASCPGRVAEVEQGYYRLVEGQLLYADRENLSLWIPVCGKPQCSHPRNNPRCDAWLGGNSFLIRGNRIYFEGTSNRYPELFPKESAGTALFSKALNGSDVRLEYVIEEALQNTVRFHTSVLMDDCWIYHVLRMNADGSETGTCYLVTETGTTILDRKEYPEPVEMGGLVVASYFGIGWKPFSGEAGFRNTFIGEDLFQIKNGKLVETGAGKYGDAGGHISGNVLRQFRPGDGYYDIDLQTGNEVKISEPALENGRSFILLPNCIVETTLGVKGYSKETHILAIFDGVQWHNVELPTELEHPSGSVSFGIHAVVSDRILFSAKMGYDTQWYQILLGTGEWSLVPC